ncbi:ComEC/Rec2 family competence protein [Spirillospora sp. NPDC050679]
MPDPKDRKRKKGDDDEEVTKDVTGGPGEVKAPTRPPAVRVKVSESTRKAAEAALASADADRAARDAAWGAAHPPLAPVSGKRGDGVLRITFVKMGAGDCTLIATPQGKVVLIDCGTNASEAADETAFRKQFNDVFGSDHYQLNGGRLDIVVLTHPDDDHVSQLNELIPDTTSPGTVYHSADYRKYVCKFGVKTWRDNVETSVDPATGKPTYVKIWRQVELNADTVEFKNSKAKKARLETFDTGYSRLMGAPIPVGPAGDAAEVEKLDGPKGGMVIVNEDLPDGQRCKITLLAAGVAYDYLGDDDRSEAFNRGSIVTLVEVYGKKLLLVGDTTRSTERYLLNQRKSKITEVDVVNAGHHGSMLTSSHEEYVNIVNPKERVVISAGKVGIAQHRLPGWPVIKRFTARLDLSARPKDAAHPVWGYERGADASTMEKIPQRVYTTGSEPSSIMIEYAPPGGGH